MTEPINSSIDIDTELEDMEPDFAALDDPETIDSSIDSDTELEGTEPDFAALDDPEPHSQAVSNVSTENQPTSGTTSASISILEFPPEIRVLIYQYALQVPFAIINRSRDLWNRPHIQARTGILFTSRLIRRESIPVFFRVNTFFFSPMYSNIAAYYSRQFSDMIQNFTTIMHIPLRPERLAVREAFTEMIRTIEDPAIIRGTFTVTFGHNHLETLEPRAAVDFYLGLLRRLTNFRTVNIAFSYWTQPTEDTPPMHLESVRNALQTALGPGTAYRTSETARGLIFHPQRFVNAQSWQQRVERLSENGRETNADEKIDGEPESPAQNSSP